MKTLRVHRALGGKPALIDLTPRVDDPGISVKECNKLCKREALALARLLRQKLPSKTYKLLAGYLAEH